MDRRHTIHPAWANRRGCFIIAAVLVLLIAALAYIGFRGDPIDELNSDIPVLG